MADIIAEEFWGWYFPVKVEPLITMEHLRDHPNFYSSLFPFQYDSPSKFINL